MGKRVSELVSWSWIGADNCHESRLEATEGGGRRADDFDALVLVES